MMEILLVGRYVFYIPLGHHTIEISLRLLWVEQVTIRVRDGKKLTHEGIKVEFVGSIGQCSSIFELSLLE